MNLKNVVDNIYIFISSEMFDIERVVEYFEFQIIKINLTLKLM